MLARDTDAATEARFLRSFRDDFLTCVELSAGDLARAADLVEQYADFPLGGVDAMVVALAERHGVSQIATLDHRHFRAIRPRHVETFILLPETLQP